MKKFDTTNDMCIITDSSGNVLFSDINELNFFRKVIIDGRQRDDETLFFYDDVWYEYSRKTDTLGRTIEYLKDITKYKNMENIYTIDVLSELKIRRTTNDLFLNYIDCKAGRNEDYACVYIDANRFKAINDDYGHEQGDKAISDIGKAIKANIRTEDIGGRIGGDEFLIVLKQMGEEQVIKKVQQIINMIEQTKFKSGEKLTVSVGVSIGNTSDIIIDSIQDRQTELESIIKHIMMKADKAMYESKLAFSESGKSEYTTNYINEGNARKIN